MSILNSRLSKLEAAAGIGLSPMEQFQREVSNHSDVELLAAYRWLKAQLAGTTVPGVSAEIVLLVERLAGLMPGAD